MQAKRYLHGAVSLSTAHKGKPRAHPVWVLRYRLRAERIRAGPSARHG